MDEIQTDINLINKKPKSSKSIKSVKSNESAKSSDYDLKGKKINKSSTKSINSSKSVDNISIKSDQLNDKKVKEKKSKSYNTINLYKSNSDNVKTDIYFDYSSLDNLKPRNNLLEPIQYTSQHTLNELESENDKKYKVIDIDNNIKINKNDKSDTIININDISNSEKKQEDVETSSRNSNEDLMKEKENDKIDIEKNEKDDKDSYNDDNCMSKENTNESKEPLINKNEKESDNEKQEDVSCENKLSEEEEKRQKLIEYYLKMPVRKTGLQCPWSLKQTFGLIIIAYSIAVNYYLIFNGEYNTVPKYIVLAISFLNYLIINTINISIHFL